MNQQGFLFFMRNNQYNLGDRSRANDVLIPDSPWIDSVFISMGNIII